MIYFVDMNPKIPKSRKSRSAGISLEPDLIRDSKEYAVKNGYGKLSVLVRKLLTDTINDAANQLEKTGDELQRRAKGK